MRETRIYEICQYVLVHTCTSQFILTHTSHVKVCNGSYCCVVSDKYIPVCTGSYWYVLVHTSTDKYKPVQTSTYLYVLVCTGTYQEFLDSKKLQTGFEPVILCISLHTLPLDCERAENEFRVSIQPNVGVYIKLVLFMSLYLALDDELTAPDPLHRPHRP